MKQNLWLGIDVGGTKLLGAAVADDLKIAGILNKATLRDSGPDIVVDRIVGLSRELISLYGDVKGIGVGFAGLVDYKTGNVMSSIMLEGWDNFPLAARISSALDNIPVFVDNDATAAGYGEYLALGSPEGMNMVLLTVGTGIGGAIIIDGRLYRGSTGISAEFGNTTIDQHGTKCWCGNSGCLNMFASGSAISERAAQLLSSPGPIPVEQVRRMAENGDERAAAALEEGARALGAGVANIINIFNPDRVVITGGVSVLGESWLKVVREEVEARAFVESATHAKVALSVIGIEVGALGAAGMAMDCFKDKN